ncbi:MAG TPA: AMP-binding protein [Candidatus Acidoferrales bacterium]|nr:AMP-binding protein [Candidatus Acidoferrales bacterium]
MVPERANRIHLAAGSSTVGELGDAFARRRLNDPALGEQPVAFACAGAEEAIGAAAALADRPFDALLLPLERLTPDVLALLAAQGWGVQDAQGRLTRPARAATAEPGRVTLLTSGTTGTPKLVPHRWETLFTLRRAGEARPMRWLLTYQSGTYAWFQMVTLALFVRGQELVAGDEPDPAGLLALAAGQGANAISSTPTFWRFALLTTDTAMLDALAFEQLTLGGERVDQAVLDQLHARFPRARLSHIYASTEVGAAIVVHDGREGFPAAWMSPPDAPADPSAVQFRVEDGRLLVRSPYASPAGEGWVDTGDEVEHRGDRILVTGRRGATLINVGGLKVAPHAVEEVLLHHADVAWCRVRGQASRLVGALVAADVVLRPGADAAAAEQALARHAAAHLPEHAVPRLWTILDAIPMTGNRKSEVA